MIKSCAERIEKELRGRIQDFKEALEEAEKEEDFNFIDWVNEYALAYYDDSYYRAKRLELSYGGPQDYFLFFEDTTIEYHFLDWFDGAKITLEGEDYKIMEQVHDYLEGRK
jgi:hypothetical protein